MAKDETYGVMGILDRILDPKREPPGVGPPEPTSLRVGEVAVFELLGLLELLLVAELSRRRRRNCELFILEDAHQDMGKGRNPILRLGTLMLIS